MRLVYWTILLFTMWIILSNNFQIFNIFIGLGISFFISLLYIKMFEHKEFEFINPFWFGVYILVLLKNLLISNIQISKRILSKDMELSPAILGVKTELKSEWKKLLLANSITLTPGTLTLEVKDDTFYIHVIEYQNGSDKQMIIKEFEDIIAKI